MFPQHIPCIDSSIHADLPGTESVKCLDPHKDRIKQKQGRIHDCTFKIFMPPDFDCRRIGGVNLFSYRCKAITELCIITVAEHIKTPVFLPEQ